MKNVNNFQIAKVQPQGVAMNFLDFFQFQPGIAYESVLGKKSLYLLSLKYFGILIFRRRWISQVKFITFFVP